MDQGGVVPKPRYFSIQGWPEGHPHLTTIEGFPFGWWPPISRNPLQDNSRDGYAASFRKLYKSYRKRATNLGYEFTLTEQDFYEITSQPCFWCAAPPSRKADKRAKNSYLYNGVDREDCRKGYILGNCVACCWTHNDLKGRLSVHDYYRHCLAVVLSYSGKMAYDIGDLECLDLLVKLFPNVRFIREHHSALKTKMRQNPKELRFNWLTQVVKPSSRYFKPED